MPAPYGILDTGLSVPTQSEIVAEMEAEVAIQPNLGSNLNTGAKSSLGQLIRIPAGAITQAYEVVQEVYNAFNPISASGVALDGLCRMRGVSPRAQATSSTTTLVFEGTAGTLIPAGSAVTLDGSVSRWITDSDVTISGLGTVSANLTAEDTGPIVALSGSTWSIDTPVSGWTGVQPSALDAVVGQNIESDAALRARYFASIIGGPGSGPDAVQSNVINVSGVTEAIVIENRSIVPDTDGRPGKSFEVVVRGGDDQAIADAIWSAKSGGSETVSTVTAPNVVVATVVDASGINQTVRYSRPDSIPVYVEIDYTPRSSAPSDIEDRIEQAILDFDAAIRLGQDVGPTDINQAILCYSGLSGVFSFLEIRMGLSSSPPIAQVVPSSVTQVADFDSSRILITRV